MKQALLALVTIVTLNAETADKKPAGIRDPGVQRPIANIRRTAVFAIPGFPDWVLILPDSVWIGNKPKGTITRLDPKTNRIVTTIPVAQLPCSGLVAGFGSVWVPSCGDKTLSRVDIASNKVVARLPFGPADTEGTITASDDSIWYLTDPNGLLLRIDPKTNQPIAHITVPPGSFAAEYGEGAVWVTCTAGNTLTRVDPGTNRITATIKVGPKPRFLAVGEGAVWTLNQGDGSISRVDPKTNRVVATIATGVPGPGGDIAVGEGSVWVTMDEVPLMRIDIASNKVVQQWVGPGGDSLRVGLGSVWLTNHKEQDVWRFSPKQP